MSNSKGGYSSAELLRGEDQAPATPAAVASSNGGHEGDLEVNGSNGHSKKPNGQANSHAASHAAHVVAVHASVAWKRICAVAHHTSTQANHAVRSCFPTSRADYASVPTEDPAAGEDGQAEGSVGNGQADRSGKWSRRHPVLLRSLLTAAGVLVILLLALLAIFLHLFLSTLSAPSPEAQKAMLDSSILLKGPDSISLLNISDAGVNVAISGQLGLDPDKALDLWLGEKKKLSAWKRWDRSWIEWVLKDIKAVKVEVGEVRIAEPDWSIDLPEQKLDLIGNSTKHGKDNSTFASFAQVNRTTPVDLLSFHIDPILIPIPELLRADETGSLAGEPILGGNGSTPRTRKSLRPISLELLFKPATPAEDILAFVNSSLHRKKVTLDLKVASVGLRGLNAQEYGKEQGLADQKGRKSWINVAKFIQLREGEIRKRFSQKIPKLDNSTDTSHLLDLDGYEFFEIKDDKDVQVADKLAANPTPSEVVTSLLSDGVSTMSSRALGIKANAIAQNPLGKILKGYVKYSLPFGVFLPVHQSPAEPLPSPPGDKPGKGDHLMGVQKQRKSNETAVDSVLMAVVAAEPFALTGKKEITLGLMGRVVPPPADALPPSSASEQAADQMVLASSDTENGLVHTLDNPAQVALSDFLSKFLRGEANTVIVHGGNPFLDPDYDGEAPPADLPGAGSLLPGWLDNAMRQLQLPISFPGSKVTDLIKNVSISDLKIHPHPFEREKLLCDGTVTGVIELPGQLSTVDVAITDLWPDIIVYNGKPPSLRHGHKGGDDDDDEDEFDSVLQNKKSGKGDDKEPEPAPPLPDPLPKHAFGRVRPHDFTPAKTYLDPEDPSGKRKLLRSELKGVPFEVLPGRGEDFRSFSWKIITGAGALAGIEGSARAKIWNSGLGKLELKNLPVKGAFIVGKRGGDDDDDDGGDDRW